MAKKAALLSQNVRHMEENTVKELSGQSQIDRESDCAYQTLLRCRDLELNLHVTRSNLCLVVEGALLAFVAPSMISLKAGASVVDKAVPLLLALSGIAVSAICIPIVRGASFWVSYWEHRLGEIEARVLPTIAIFRDHPSDHNKERLKRLPEHLKYVSSRGAMMLLFRLLTLFWVALFVFVLLR